MPDPFYGLNAGADPGLLPALRDDLHFGRIRIGVHRSLHPWADAEAILAILTAGLQPLVIVRDAHQVLALEGIISGCDVELWNEPDGTVDGHYQPGNYARMVSAFLAACQRVGAVPWIGAISNLHHSGLAWLQEMLAAVSFRLAPAEAFGVSAHWYPVGRSRLNAHSGFSSRADEVEELKWIIGERPWGISEFGFHTAPQLLIRWLPRWRWNTWAWTDQQVADNIAQEWEFWRTQGANFCCLYQITDGQENIAEDRFGIRRCCTDPFNWKPSAFTVPA